MKVIMVMVQTVNGKTTNGNLSGTSTFASSEDQDFFLNVRNENNLLIMGRKTYEAAKEGMTLTADRLKIVLTSQPERFTSEEKPNQLEFSSDQPHELLRKLSERGYTQALLLGGEKTNTDFLRAGLVDEIWLTIEPRILGKGNDLLGEADLDLNLQLIQNERLNHQGTLLLKYKVL